MPDPNPTSGHSINIYSFLRCRRTPHLSHSGKYQGSYACLDFGSLGSHSQVIAAPGQSRDNAPLKLSYLQAHTSEAFPMPGALTHIRITWALSPTAPQVVGVTPGSPLCPWCFGHSIWKGARQTHCRTISLVSLNIEIRRGQLLNYLLSKLSDRCSDCGTLFATEAYCYFTL